MAAVSILIPVFNRVGLLEATIRSAAAQTFSDVEIIVVDNCSTDGSFELACSLASQDGRIRVYRNAQNVGPVMNWRLCVSYATAAFSKILFSDDLIAPECIAKMLGKVLSRDVAFCYSPAITGEVPWEGGLIYRAFDTECCISREHFLRASVRLDGFAPVSPGAALFRTADLRKNIVTHLEGCEGYDFQSSGAGVDWLVYALTALSYPKVGYVPDPLVFFRAHPGSITVSDSPRVQEGYRLARNWLAGRVAGL